MTNNLPPSDITPLVEKSELVSQTSHGPSLNEVVSQLLRESLKGPYPALLIDPDKAQIVTPQWHVENDLVEPDTIQYETLTHALLRISMYGKKVNYLEGEHFLTEEPEGNNPVHLAVSIEEIANMLNDLAPVVFIEFQAQQLDFWNSKGKRIARWAEFSDSLRKALNMRKVFGWDADECAMAREVFNDPDKTTRKNLNPDFSEIQACLIDIDMVDTDDVRHLVISGALVLKATYRQRALLTMFTIERGYESFSSMAQLGTSLPKKLPELPPGRSLKWQLYEPEGNVFDYIAWALISLQLDAIESLRFLDEPIDDEVEPLAGLDTLDQARFKELATAIPQWLYSASTGDIQDYRRYLDGLAKLYRQPDAKTAKEEIPSISDHAQRLMQEAIIADPLAIGAARLPLNELRINITNSFTVDNFILPNPFDRRIETLADYAIGNEAPYLATVHFENAEAVPAWLTPAFLTTVSARVDIGLHYPLLLKNTLIDDPVKSLRQEKFFRAQLRFLLPLTALECKAKQQSGVDEQGYRYICNLLDPSLDATQSIAIYPLSMTPQHRLISSSDRVANMFIIGPQHVQTGPCLLYRPMLDPPLLQFPSQQNLLYALHQPGELRDSVLAWLPSKTLNFEYAQYVFPTGLPSPWLLAEQVLNPLQRVDRFGQVVFQLDEITGDILSALFKSNVNALVALADRQSQSNAERRWHLLKDSLWALFNVASNMLSGTVGTAVWLWQTINQLQQTLDAHEQGDRLIEWASVADILLTVSIILSHHVVKRRKDLSSTPRRLQRAKKTTDVEVAPPVITLNSTPLIGELPFTHCRSLEVAGTVPRRTPSMLGAYLDTLKVDAPDLTHADLTTIHGAPPHLYQLNYKTYAQIAERWFSVSVDGDEQVYIVNPNDHSDVGPLLLRSHQQWVLDLRLRLRGGGPKNRLRQMRAAKEIRKHELESYLSTFKTQEASTNALLTDVQNRMLAAKTKDYERLSGLYLEKLEGRIGDYQQALKHLREWRNLGGTAGYTYDLLRLSTELQKDLALWFSVKKNEYNKATDALRAVRSREATLQQDYVKEVTYATDLSHQMIEKLTLSNTTMQGMEAAGRAGIQEAIHISKMMPLFTVLQFKANEIGMSMELCIQEQASSTMDEAREAFGKIVLNSATGAHQLAEQATATSTGTAPQETIKALGNLIEIFSDADERILELPESYPEMFKQPALDHLRSLISEFAQEAQDRLQSLLPDVEPSAAPPEKARPSPSRATKTKSTFRLHGPSQNVAQKATDTPLKPFIPARDPQPQQALKDSDVIEAGLELTLGLNAFIEQTRKDALRPRRIPADMQDIFDQRALKLEQSASAVDLAVERSKATDSPLGVATLGLELRQHAQRMRKEGVNIRAILYKQRKPTQNSFRWMQKYKQVYVTRNPQGRIQTKQRGDYFQEYPIVDVTHHDQVLWVAHFHYKSFRTPVDQPTAAHLKIADSYLKTLTPEQQQALGSLDQIDYILRTIDDPELRKLFLDLEPPAHT